MSEQLSVFIFPFTVEIPEKTYSEEFHCEKAALLYFPRFHQAHIHETFKNLTYFESSSSY